VSGLTEAVAEDELAELRQRWPQAAVAHRRLTVSSPFLTGEHQQLFSDGRRAEICYLMHRGLPGDGLLLHTKTIYPIGAYRLPTGGIQQGEAALTSLAREIAEETGLKVGDGPGCVRVQAFAGVLSYDLVHRELDKVFPFATYHFLVEMPAGGVIVPQDADEYIEGWQWRPVRDMAEVAAHLEGIGREAPAWADWGRFRALSHRFVAGTLAAAGA
jgi:8-oxo-dGTP pyrophosphatase MutT (NUDIX family)